MFEKTRTLLAVYRARDPRGLTAADTLFRAPGFHAVLAHRAAHFCALQGWRGLADGIAALSAQMTGVRIHADARVGENVYLAPGVWLGPDAVIPDGAEVFPEGPALLAAPGTESEEARLKKVEGALSEALLLIRAQEEKIEALKAARNAGMEICSGGIIGMGETPAQRIELAMALRELGVKSVPVNILAPIKGTPLENMPLISEDDVLRTIAIFRFILPDAALRFAGGRARLSAEDTSEAYRIGINASIMGDMLTTAGADIDTDIARILAAGYCV